MISAFKKIWDFAGSEQKNIKKSIVLALLHSVFYALQFAAVYVVLKALTSSDTSKINANTDIANVWFSDPANVTSDYTIATNASGQVQITCTNSAAVTVYVVLFNP